MDERIKARLSESEASRYQREPSRSVLQHKLRQYQLGGHDLNQLIDRITAASLTGARSISNVLHGRLEAIKPRRAGIAAGYREAAGITDPEQAISPKPHSARPELDAMREATIGALEITEDPYRAMTCGQLEAKVAKGDRAQGLAPPDVSGQLRRTAQAEADAWQQSADAEVRHDQAEAASAKTLAGQFGAEKARLEAIHADYESWSGKTREAREVAGKAEAELQRRGMRPQEPEKNLVEWNQQFEDDLAAVDRAITRERQAALDAGEPWPPERETLGPAPDPDAGACGLIAQLQRDGYVSHVITTEPEEAAEPSRWPPLIVLPRRKTRQKPLAPLGHRPSRVSRNPSLTENPPPTSASQVTALPA